MIEPYYQTELGKLYCGDCVAVMQSIPENSIDLTVTSPPYDNLRDYKGYSFDFENVARELYRVTAKGGIVVWVVGDATVDGSETGTSFRQALFFKSVGFNIHDTMIYIKKGGLNSGSLKAYQQKFEFMFVFSKEIPKSINLIKDRANIYTEPRKKLKHQPDGSYKEQMVKIEPFGVRYNYWIYDTGSGKGTKDTVAFEHPATFPEQLAKDHILSWSNEGDLVLDPFMGSGTTGKMAEITRRKWMGIEISKEYCDVAISRLKRWNGQVRLDTGQSNDASNPPSPEGKGIESVKS